MTRMPRLSRMCTRLLLFHDDLLQENRRATEKTPEPVKSRRGEDRPPKPLPHSPTILQQVRGNSPTSLCSFPLSFLYDSTSLEKWLQPAVPSRAWLESNSPTTPRPSSAPAPNRCPSPFLSFRRGNLHIQQALWVATNKRSANEVHTPSASASTQPLLPPPSPSRSFPFQPTLHPPCQALQIAGASGQTSGCFG